MSWFTVRNKCSFRANYDESFMLQRPFNEFAAGHVFIMDDEEHDPRRPLLIMRPYLPDNAFETYAFTPREFLKMFVPMLPERCERCNLEMSGKILTDKEKEQVLFETARKACQIPQKFGHSDVGVVIVQYLTGDMTIDDVIECIEVEYALKDQSA